ncbi:MAG: anthranilate synthase component I, partial [Nitratireductor sp.]|nr:anthranilate synthase component I [Nitratireductor sp.]
MVSHPIAYVTKGGVKVRRESFPATYQSAISDMLDRIDSRRGAVFSSNYEYPGRYTRWDTAVVDPPLGIEARGRSVSVIAYNERGLVLLDGVEAHLKGHDHVAAAERQPSRLLLSVREAGHIASEEMRSRAPTVFSVVRAIVDLFFSEDDPNIGLYGAFGYDLAFQFENIEQRLERPDSLRDLVLYLPDEILVVDHHQAVAWHDRYEFEISGKSTDGLARGGEDHPFVAADFDPPRGDHVPGEYARIVEAAKEKFKRGDLFEVVPGQTFYERCTTLPSAIARKLKAINPSPYS